MSPPAFISLRREDSSDNKYSGQNDLSPARKYAILQWCVNIFILEMARTTERNEVPARVLGETKGEEARSTLRKRYSTSNFFCKMIS